MILCRINLFSAPSAAIWFKLAADDSMICWKSRPDVVLSDGRAARRRFCGGSSTSEAESLAQSSTLSLEELPCNVELD